MARAGRGFLNRPTRPTVRKSAASPVVGNDLGGVGLSATATVSAALVVNDLGAVSVDATPSVALTLAVRRDDLGAVAVTAKVGTVVGLRTPAALGAVTLSTQVAATVGLSQPGTLANPYAATESATRSLDFTSALYVLTEPVPHTGPLVAPSIWYTFTDSEAATWLASTSGFAHGATIELYAGMAGAAVADDVTFIATDGVLPVTLGAVAVGALVNYDLLLQAMVVDLGAVSMDSTAIVMVPTLGTIDLGAIGVGSVVDVAAVLS